MDLPENESKWMTVTLEHLILRRRAYWVRLMDDDKDTVDQKTVTIDIPKKNIFDVNTLTDLMKKSRVGDL